MSGDIVAAVRGGPGSHHTRLAALQMAATRQTAVRFVSVIDSAEYDAMHPGEQQAIRSEMAWKDLALARATQREHGLDDVRFTVEIRSGPLLETITGYATEIGADRIVVGRSGHTADAVGTTNGGLAAVLASHADGLPVDVVGPAVG